MDSFELKLIPYGKAPLTVRLKNDNMQYTSIEAITEATESVFADLSYQAELLGDDVDDVKNISFYVNDTFEKTIYSDGNIKFTAFDNRERRIFSDCYGYVEIVILLQFSDGSEKRLRSNYLSVLVRKGALNDSVKSMVDYVYKNQEEFLFNGEVKPQNISGLKDSEYKNLESKLILAEEIVSIYETSYGYFRANSRFKVEQQDVVDRLEKLQYITLKTLQYTVQHPEQMQQVHGTIGIRVANRIYHPRHTLITQNMQSTDIYENRVVVSFLKKMVDSIGETIAQINILLVKFPLTDIFAGDYIHSPSLIFSGTIKLLKDSLTRFQYLRSRFEYLWSLYSTILHTAPINVEYAPKPTAVFLSVPQYNKIFVCIYQWFRFGIYDLERENFMFSFVKISLLYEHYVLAKLINYFQHNGFRLESANKSTYPVLDRWKYNNTSCSNTFVFQDDERKITLYYQPVIFDTDHRHVNGVGVYRNNTHSLYSDETGERRGHYYVPDFLIKVQGNTDPNSGREDTRYIICDAKFSTLSSIQKYQIAVLAYKYLFSISPIQQGDKICGLCIIYGQCTKADVMQSIYDKQLSGYRIEPFAETLPLMENAEDEVHFELIAKLLDMV